MSIAVGLNMGKSLVKDSPLADVSLPVWASDFGEDQYGTFIEFTIGSVKQRMQWIPPGVFLMGSPKEESGRCDYEVAPCLVFIDEGYWMFNTPCTQALWQEVMGYNDSRFRTPDRPVETIDWEEVQRFIWKLNIKLPGIDVNLPTEAQWEYSCRAGSKTAIYTGNMEILGEKNSPDLEPIAWYGGLRDKLTDDPVKFGTQPVGLKVPNKWGLYDMLGNVNELCIDNWYWVSEDSPPRNGCPFLVDPNLLPEAYYRVIRGGSWESDAYEVRSAHRDRTKYGTEDTLGFRCISELKINGELNGSSA